MDVRRQSGFDMRFAVHIVLAVRRREGEAWTYNPDAAEKIGPGMTLVVLGSPEQVNQLKDATK